MNVDTLFGITIGTFLGVFLTSRSILFSLYIALGALVLAILLSTYRSSK